jgi:hypothetical protein
MTPDEIISSIKKTTIPTLCVEGVQDKHALRLFEKMIGINGSILPCKGRNNLFEVWKRRAEFGDKKVAFLADKDLYVFGKIPSEYNGIIFTYGYSLENDILLTKRWMKFLSPEDCLIFKVALGISLNYYWHECKKAFESGDSPVWMSSFRLYQDNISGIYKARSGSECCKLYKKISSNPFKYLRGKNLLECVHLSLSHNNRSAKYNAAHIIDMSVRPDGGRYLKVILKKISKELAIGGTSQ